MRLKVQSLARKPDDPTAEPFAPPARRALRAHALHRLQVGIFGICAMLLIVGLANIIMNRARLAEAANPPELSLTDADKIKSKGSDPLADIGVVPAADPSAMPILNPKAR
jgi:hypothetical protein